MSFDSILILSVLGYILFLWIVGKIFESNVYKEIPQRDHLDKIIYILGFGAYCTTWTYYGSIEGAATSGMKYITVYLGPAIGTFFWSFILKKMISLKEKYGITNIPDLINILYDKSKLISTIITLFFIIGLIPYIALQLKAILYSSAYLLNKTGNSYNLMSFIIGISFIVFSIHFGSKNLNDSKHRSGLSGIIAIESLVKLLGLMLIGGYIVFVKGFNWDSLVSLSNGFINEKVINGEFSNLPNITSWISITFLSFFAFTFLPRQFHMCVVENKDIKHVKHARWGVPLYLFLIVIFIIPISIYGMAYLPETVEPSLYMLGIPFTENLNFLTIIVFLGGYSAAAGMIILEVTTLTNMVSNNVVLPYLQKRKSPLTKNIVHIKWAIIIALITMSYLYMLIAGNTSALISMGLISFVCTFQLAPTIIGGLLWRNAHRRGALVSLGSGIIIWCYTLFLPAIFENISYLKGIVINGPFGIEFLKPYSFLGITSFDPITHSMFWTLVISLPLYIIYSIKGHNDEVKQSIVVLSEDIEEEVTLKINLNDLYERVGKGLEKYYKTGDCKKVINTISQQLNLVDLDDITGFDLLEIVKLLEIKLFQDLGSIAGSYEIDQMLLPKERDFIYKSEFKKIQRKLNANDKINSLGLLTSGLAHELINPANIMLQSSNILNEKINKCDISLDGKDYKKQIISLNQIIGRMVNKSYSIIRKMLDQTSIANLKMEKDFLNEYLESAVTEAEDISLALYQLSISVNFKSNTPVKFMIDGTELKKSFKSILDNSLYAMNEKKKQDDTFSARLEVDLSYSAHSLIIKIKDNGVGIKSKNIDNVFTPFFTRKPTGHGNLGLGLFQASEIIYAHKGEISMNSEKGKYTLVTIKLPFH